MFVKIYSQTTKCGIRSVFKKHYIYIDIPNLNVKPENHAELSASKDLRLRPSVRKKKPFLCYGLEKTNNSLGQGV